MTPEDFPTSFVQLYRCARVLSVPSQNVTRARARSVSSQLEELVAAYLAANAESELHIYVDQPVGIGDGKVAYPDLVILNLQSKTVVSIIDVKTDIGWNRDRLREMCEKLDRTRRALVAQGSVKLGPDPKSRVPYAVSANLSSHLVVGASANSGNDLQTPEAKQLAENSQVHLYILIEGKHPNHFSRLNTVEFPGMRICTENLTALVKGISA